MRKVNLSPGSARRVSFAEDTYSSTVKAAQARVHHPNSRVFRTKLFYSENPFGIVHPPRDSVTEGPVPQNRNGAADILNDIPKFLREIQLI